MKEVKKLNVVVPAVLDWDWYTPEKITEDLIEQKNNYGIDRFILAFPNKGFTSTNFPSNEYAIEYAKNFQEVKKNVAPLGIECGWWFSNSIKSGYDKNFTRMITQDGEETFYSSCPLDPAFRERIYDFTATFTKYARPEFIFMEDDFSIHASTGGYGCFCKFHLDEFAKRKGRYFTAEELVAIFETLTDDAIALLREWRELMKDSLVMLAEEIRRAVDSVDPSIPIGAMEAGTNDQDGDSCYAIAKALAGDRHTPFSRLYGAIYNGVSVQDIPRSLFHTIYSKQHITEDFEYFFESDCFPHTRYFTSGKEMQAMISIVYSAGFDGSTLQTQQLLDDANEDTAFGYAFAKERPRHEAIHKEAKNCELRGVEITFDPFYNTVDLKSKNPFWCRPISFFGIPSTSLRCDVAFWDRRQAMFFPHEKVMDYLSKTLFLDGDAAKALCKRGYREYLGVEMGDDTATVPFVHDQCAREVIRDGYAPDSKGRNMTAAHFYSAGNNGKSLYMSVTDKNVEVLTDVYSFRRELLYPAMTRFKNKLGGTVIVMGLTIERNYSQALLNYRRQKLFQQLIIEAADKFVLVRNDPRIHVLMNEPKEEAKGEFIGVLTLINLSSDDREKLSLHLPSHWRAYKEILSLNELGEWIPAKTCKTEDGVDILERADYLKPVYLMFK